jgi:hypothetical protein
VALAVGQVYQGGKDEAGDFIRSAARGNRDAGDASFSGTHGFACLTPGGKFLGSTPVQGLAAWRALPEEERKPGAVTIPASGRIDEKKVQPSPPAGGLILRLFYRHLGRDESGKLGLATQEDFPFGRGRVNLDAQPNYLWLTETESESLLPREPVVGRQAQIADSIADRICLKYLHPVLSFCACSGWSKDQRRGQDLRLIVEEVSADNVRMRLEGFADLGAPFQPAKADDLKGPFGYEPRLSGYLCYNPRTSRISRFEFVALGDTYGYPNTDDAAWKPSWRAGRQPLGVAFEMISGATASERIPPRVLP